MSLRASIAVCETSCIDDWCRTMCQENGVDKSNCMCQEQHESHDNRDDESQSLLTTNQFVSSYTDEQSKGKRRRSTQSKTELASLDLWRLQNLAIPLSYLAVGTLQGLFRTFLNVYPLNLGASEAQQTTCSTLATLPAAFKIIYGFSSDLLPLFGYRRKSHLFLGWVLASVVMGSLWLTSNLTLQRLDNGTSTASTTMSHSVVIVPDDAPSLVQLSWTFFFFGVGMWYADATADAVVAEKARLEPEAIRGSLQATCYMLRFFGLMISASISTYLYSTVGPQVIVRALTWIPCLILPFVWCLAEAREGEQQNQDSDRRGRGLSDSFTATPFIKKHSLRDQWDEIWRTVCSRSVWEPMAFIYVFNLLQVSNAAWRQFLVTVLGFTEANLNTLLVVSYVLVYFGTIMYKYCLLQTSWRLIYQGCLVLNLVFSAMQLLLIRGYTLGLSPFVFALGDDAFAEFLNGVQFLPTVIMMVSLCPPGSEGASYAMFTTVMNSALMISPAISSLLLGIWDVSKDALEKGDLDGLFNLSLLTTVIQISPLLFLGWLPRDRKELEALASKPFSGSPIGGGIFLSVLFCSMAWTFVVAILNIVRPNWAGGS
ncbi:hypothetical protein ACA910_021401 [Epithemia clementina (nom. ined.)]